MRGERGRVGNDPVDHEPFARAEGLEPALRHAPLECRARLLYLDSRGRQRAGGLPSVLHRDLDHAHTAALERATHPFGKELEPGDREFFSVLGHGAQSAIGPSPPDRRGDVGAHDGRDAGVPHHPPQLDAVEELDRPGRERAGSRQGVHSQLPVFHRIGAGERFDVGPTEARFGHRGCRNRARREHRLDPGARHDQRVRRAQPR